MTDDAGTDSDHEGTDFHENLIENSFDYWFDSELERKDLSRDDFEKGKVLFKTPFASQQMDELNAGEGDIEVYVNDDADVVFLVSLDADRDIQEGDEIYFDEIDSLDDVYIKPEEEDYGYFILAKLPDGSYTYAFDFRRNRQYQNEMIEAAEEFIRAAEDALSREDWRVFIENAFQASEKILKIPIISFGMNAETHSQIQSNYSKIIKMGIGNNDIYDTYNKLKDKYRFAGSYVDPRGDVDEKEFELSNSEAEDMLEDIKTARDDMREFISSSSSE